MQRLNSLSTHYALQLRPHRLKSLLHQIFNSILPKYRSTERKPSTVLSCWDEDYISSFHFFKCSSDTRSFSFFLKKDRSYCSPGIHSVRPGGPGTHRDLFAFAPQMLGLKAFAISPGLESIFKFKNYLNATLKI